MTSDPSLFMKILPVPNGSIITTTNGSTLKATHIGNIDTFTLCIPDTYLVLNLSFNLISIGQLCDLDFDLHSSKQYGCIIQDHRTGQKVRTGCKVRTLFELECLKIPQYLIYATTPQVKSFSTSLDLWHSRLGHTSFSRIKSLASIGVLGKVSHDTSECLSCQFGKQQASPFNNSESSSSAPFDLVHYDIWGIIFFCSI